MDLERFRRNSGQGEQVDINGEKFYFKPMPLSQLPGLMDFGRITQEQGEKALMRKDNAERLFQILSNYVSYCFPELKDDEEVLDGFIINNMQVIQETMIKLSMPKLSGNLDDSKKSAIAKMKNDIKQGTTV